VPFEKIDCQTCRKSSEPRLIVTLFLPYSFRTSSLFNHLPGPRWLCGPTSHAATARPHNHSKQSGR
jgi:hypothetical protein